MAFGSSRQQAELPCLYGTSRMSVGQMLEPLATALCQCVSIILLGLLCRLLAILSSADAAGLSAFVGRLSMPALLFMAMAELDVQLTEWRLVAAVCAAKALVFAGTAGLCFAASVVKARSRAAESAEQLTVHSGWLCRAGLYSIFVTQSNDFALGVPLCAAIWGARPSVHLSHALQNQNIMPCIMAAIRKSGERRATWSGEMEDSQSEKPISLIWARR